MRICAITWQSSAHSYQPRADLTEQSPRRSSLSFSSGASGSTRSHDRTCASLLPFVVPRSQMRVRERPRLGSCGAQRSSLRQGYLCPWFVLLYVPLIAPPPPQSRVVHAVCGCPHHHFHFSRQAAGLAPSKRVLDPDAHAANKQVLWMVDKALGWTINLLASSPLPRAATDLPGLFSWLTSVHVHCHSSNASCYPPSHTGTPWRAWHGSFCSLS